MLHIHNLSFCQTSCPIHREKKNVYDSRRRIVRYNLRRTPQRLLASYCGDLYVCILNRWLPERSLHVQLCTALQFSYSYPLATRMWFTNCWHLVSSMCNLRPATADKLKGKIQLKMNSLSFWKYIDWLQSLCLLQCSLRILNT